MEYCNPIDIEYKFQHYGKRAQREAADPTLVLFKGTYYLFASMSAGFYYSDDLCHWKWHENRELDMYQYAPDVRQIGDYLYFSASGASGPCKIRRTKNPLHEEFEIVSEPFTFWDPNLFCDDDGRVYLYWGCGNGSPLWGIELDSKSFMPIGEKAAMLDSDISIHGWERFTYPCERQEQHLHENENGLIGYLLLKYLNRTNRPYMEGVFVNKYEGKYYMQYSAPDTAATTYGDGYYVSDSPLGPYRFGENTPFSFKPNGFIKGAGHGSTIQDKNGNWWHASTMRISANSNFERRVGLFPCGFDSDGVLLCNQNFADYPITMNGKQDIYKTAPDYMLLSYKKKVEVSSAIDEHAGELAVNEDVRSWWCAKGNKGEWIQVDLGKEYSIHSIQLNFAEESIKPLKMPKKECSGNITTRNRYIDSGHNVRTNYRLEASLDGVSWTIIRDNKGLREDQSHPYIVLEEDTSYRYIKVTCHETPYDSKFAVSGIRVFGLGHGDLPKATRLTMIEEPYPMSKRLTWEKIDGTIGYNIRWGIAPDKLYHSQIVYEETNDLITAINEGQEYWCCVDSFNESGVTCGEIRKMN